MKRLTLLIFVISLIVATPCWSLDKVKADADRAYSKNDYTTAIGLYESILQKGESADIYYNLGNAYYKHNEIAKSILNYERALLLQPYNEDVRNNLEIARSKTLDKVDPAPEIFFITWIKSLINLMSVDRWGKIGIVCFLLFIVAVYFYVFSKRITVKKIGFVGGLIFLTFTVLANIFAYTQRSALIHRDGAIVMSHSVVVRSTPSDGGTKLFVIHDGRKVKVSDDSMADWKEITLEDGKVGWVHKNDIAII